MDGRFVAYYRVSTARQGRSGLGLQAQKSAVKKYLDGGSWELLGEFQDVETGKGSNALERRPGLREAAAMAKKRRATLLIAKLDRLARNVHFVSGLMETGVRFRCCDFPTADPTMLHIYAAMAEGEGRRISLRIKEGLAAKRARGEPLGHPQTLRPLNKARTKEADQFAKRLRPTLLALRRAGHTQRGIVDELNGLGIKAPRGGEWSLVQVQRVLARMA